MGKKQRLKRERQNKVQVPAPRPKATSAPWAWLLGVVLFLAAVIVVIVVMARMNQGRLLRFSLVAGCQQTEQDLDRAMGKFTIDDGQALKDILGKMRTVAADPKLNAPVAANLNFMLNVIKEIISQGNLQPEELAKLRTLLGDTQKKLAAVKPKSKPNP